MVNYTTTPARDVETGLGQETVVLVEKKSSSGWMGKLLLAMFLMLVCSAGAVFFTWFSSGRQEVRLGQLLGAVVSLKTPLSLIPVGFSHRLFRLKPKR